MIRIRRTKNGRLQVGLPRGVWLRGRYDNMEEAMKVAMTHIEPPFALRFGD